jgi:hypothetical protein
VGAAAVSCRRSTATALPACICDTSTRHGWEPVHCGLCPVVAALLPQAHLIPALLLREPFIILPALPLSWPPLACTLCPALQRMRLSACPTPLALRGASLGTGALTHAPLLLPRNGHMAHGAFLICITFTLPPAPALPSSL